MRTTAQGLPDADELARSSGPILQSLVAPVSESGLGADALTVVSPNAMFHLLPLLMSALQAVGELISEDRDSFLQILTVFRKRLLACPRLRARFLVHVAHPSYSTYWLVNHNEQNPDDQTDRAIILTGPDDVDTDADVEDDAEDWKSPDIDSQDDDPDLDSEPEQPSLDDEQPSVLIRTREAATAGLKARAVKQVILSLPLDDADKRTKSFWTNEIHQGNGDDPSGHQVVEGFEYDLTENGGVRNPFLSPDSNLSEQEDHHLSNENAVGNVVCVRKVFSSIARPFLVTIHATANSDDTIGPSILVKSGDDLTQDLAVSLMFQTLNSIWANDDTLLSSVEEDMIPMANWYDVAPTQVTQGILRGVANLRSLSAHDWRDWTKEAKDDREVATAMARSAAGGYVATYIIGGRDRHFDNIVIHDNRHLMHIDFTYILGKKPPLDAPPIAIASEMQDAFEEIGIWSEFVACCSEAFGSARRNSAQLLSTTTIAFARTGIPVEKAVRFIRGKRSLDLNKSDDVAIESFSRQIEYSSRSAQTWVKRLAHQFVDPAWYALIRSGFPPATAIVALMDKAENKEAEKLANRLKLAADGVTDDDRVRLEEQVSDEDD